MTTSRLLPRRALLPPLLVALCGALSSCAVGPNYQRPALTVPGAFKTGAPAEATPAPALAANWWTLFGDPALNRLAEDTLAANLNIQAAIARVEQARQSRIGARGEFAPALNVDASARRARTAGGTNNQFSLPLDLSYEVDLWGRLRRQYEYYQNTEAASADDLAWVQQTAAAEVVQAYFTIGLYDREIGLFEETLSLYRQQAALTETKYNAGLALPTEVLQAKNQVNSATNQLIDVRRARAKQEHAIAILLGRAPSEFTLAAVTLPTTFPAVPAGLPVTLLDRRVDVAETEHQLAAANAQIGVATANFFPTFSLTGSAGYQSINTSRLLDWESRVWSIGPSLNLPIFQGGRLTAALAQSKARYAELLANYRNAVLGAFRDVEDQLSDLQLLNDKSRSLEDTLTSAREYARLTDVQYKQGLTTYLQVIDANQTLLTSELTAAQTQADRLSGTVLLIKALGGGWQNPPPATPPEAK